MRKKFLALLIPGLLAVAVASAQTTPPAQANFARWSLGLTAGPAFPVGKFASKDINSNGSGHARTGVAAAFSLTRWLTSSFGLVFAAAAQENAIGTFQTAINPATGGATVVNDPWRSTRFSLGATVNQPIGTHGLSVYFRALAGLLKASIPAYTYHFTYGTGYVITGVLNNEVDVQSSPMPWTFAYEGAAGIRRQLKNKWFVLAEASYMGSDPEFKKTLNIIGSGPATYTHRQPIATVQLAIGGGISF